MKRREFLKVAGTTAAMAVPGASLLAATRQNVIIIGAGMAGLTAAKQLRANGNTVVILEARNRIGGRGYTSTKWADAPTDLGASWIHESQGNPLTAIAAAAGIPIRTTDYNSAVTFDTNLGKIPTGTGSQYETVQNNYNAAVAKGYNTNTDMDTRTFIESSAGMNYATMDNQTKKLANHFVVSWGDDDYGGDSGEMSSWYWDSMKVYAGLDAVPVGGYVGILNYLAQGTDIRLNQIVTNVAYTSTGVTVTTKTGVFAGDRVIVTVPLGVLKKGSITFSPALPAKKLTAISKLGMGSGTLQKVFLRFPNIFWDDVDWIEHIPTVANRGQYNQWLNCARVNGGIPILLCFNGGFYGVNEEAKTDAQILADAMSALRDMYGANIPDPVDYQFPRWDTDPYALGSYSYFKVGSTPTMRTDLAAPVNNRVFFAGEATHHDYWATMHGAHLSGLAAATAISKV